MLKKNLKILDIAISKSKGFIIDFLMEIKNSKDLNIGLELLKITSVFQ